SGSQQTYTTKFFHLLSQLDCKMPEIVKRRFYQQYVQADTSAFVSQNVPSTLQKMIELAQRFEDACGAASASSASSQATKVKRDQSKPQTHGKSTASKKNQGGQTISH
ncbi:hypothetical protein F444_05953, partial [Phytophthora nicotianae P1976]